MPDKIGRNRQKKSRIYRSPGGARRLAMPALDAGAIDKGSDGRGRISAQRMMRERERRRRGKPPIPEPEHKQSGSGRKYATKREIEAGWYPAQEKKP